MQVMVTASARTTDRRQDVQQQATPGAPAVTLHVLARRLVLGQLTRARAVILVKIAHHPHPHAA